MKIHKCCALVILIFSGVTARSQTAVPITVPITIAPAQAVIPTPIASTLTGTSATDGHSTFSLGLNWNESVRHFSVAVPNKSATQVSVLAVQGTGALYLTAFPSTIAANGTGDFHCLLLTDPGSGPEINYLNVLTSTGKITVEIDNNRVSVAQYSTNNLQWSVGASSAAQSITLTMTPSTSVPIGVQALGTGNTATLLSNGAQKYTIAITPGSTASAETFPVVVIFNPALPGVSGVITCEVK